MVMVVVLTHQQYNSSFFIQWNCRIVSGNGPSLMKLLTIENVINGFVCDLLQAMIYLCNDTSNISKYTESLECAEIFYVYVL